MPSNNFPGFTYLNTGFDKNFFAKFTVSATTFGGNSANSMQPDIFITFTTQGIALVNYGNSITNTIEYSFNGNVVHGQLSPTTPSSALIFDNRIVSAMWFRVQSGSTASTISVEAWSIP
jgi:hypothetical protein